MKTSVEIKNIAKETIELIHNAVEGKLVKTK